MNFKATRLSAPLKRTKIFIFNYSNFRLAKSKHKENEDEENLKPIHVKYGDYLYQWVFPSIF